MVIRMNINQANVPAIGQLIRCVYGRRTKLILEFMFVLEYKKSVLMAREITISSKNNVTLRKTKQCEI